MNPIELTKRGSDEVVAHACGKCGVVARSEEAATRCCAPSECKECGKETETYWLLCRDCKDKKDAKDEREAFEAAAKVLLVEYDHDYVSRNRYGDESEYLCIDEIDDIADEDERTWYWACRPLPWPRLDARGVVDHALEEDFPEDAADWLDVEGLQAKLDEWREAQGEPRCFIVDETRVVVVRGGEWAVMEPVEIGVCERCEENPCTCCSVCKGPCQGH